MVGGNSEKKAGVSRNIIKGRRRNYLLIGWQSDRVSRQE